MLKDRYKFETLINDLSVLIDRLVESIPLVQDRQVKLSVEDAEYHQQDTDPSFERLEEAGFGFGEIFANVDPILEWCIRIRGRLILDDFDVGEHLPTYEEAMSELALSCKGIDGHNLEKDYGASKYLHFIAGSSIDVCPDIILNPDPYTRFFSTASYPLVGQE
jgi:hypothetical protein